MGDAVSSTSKKRPTPFWWWAASLLLVIGGVVGFLLVPRGQLAGPSLSTPFGDVTLAPSTSTTTPVTTTTRPETTTTLHGATTTTVARTTTSEPASAHIIAAPPIGRSRPVYLSIPAIGVATHLTLLGLNRDGTVQVPTDFQVPGWFRYGVTPGEKGSAVILGHVDSYKGPAVFYRLATLRVGNRVFVKLANGHTLHFAVIGLREYSKGSFPDRLVYGSRGYPALQLVTCGGVFDRQTGHYLSNIVVFTALVKS
jgi:hypothetical protein